MSVTEIKQAMGRWELRLREDTPKEVLNALTFYGHIAILPGELSVAQYGNNLLASARYVGVYRGRDAQNDFTLKGSGMAYWLGDEDDKGDIFETPVVLNAATHANSVRALLPPGGAVTEGTLHSVAGTYTGTHRFETSRRAITYVTETFGSEWRVNNNGTLDAGTVAQLYVTTPKALLMRKETGADLARKAISGNLAMGTDVEDTTTRVLLLAEGEGTGIFTVGANGPATPYKDLFGNPLKSTRLVSESGTESGNAAARAQLMLNRFSNARRAVQLSTSEYDVKGTFVVGDYLDVYDPQNEFVDPAREAYWKGERINPMALRCVEMTWPIPSGWTVAFRDVNGNWIDLSRYYVGESGDTTIVVGDLPRGLASVGGEPVGVRPNLPDAETPASDTTIPGVPAFTGFSTGVYETLDKSLAAIQATWTQPLNVDGSTIQDGDHYEIRYRPNAIIGAPVSWDILSGGYALDYDEQFNTPVTGALGAGWALIGTGSEFNVVGGEAQVTHNTFNSIRGAYRWTTVQSPRVEIRMDSSINYMPAGASTVMGTWFRYDGSNNYWWRVEPNTDASVTVKLWRMKAGAWTELVVYKVPGMVHTAGVRYHTKATLYDDTLTYKVWQGTPEDEPQEDQINYWDQDALTGTGCVGFYDYVVDGATNPAGLLIRHSYVQARSLDPDNVANAYSWDELGTWDAPTSEPVTVTPNWSTAYVGWGQTTYTLSELGAGIKYELQIRAVDTASPPHQGAWSASSFVNTSGDVIAPSAPAAPLVAASMIGVQIEHRLGKASGGAFNLEQDLARLEVHASHTPTFTPSADTKVGDLIATGAMVRGGITAVGAFKVDQPASVWIRVVAVDRMGNASSPSEAVQSSVDLIDDAHISNLSVSKLTAGTITAQSVLAAQMEVGPGGNIRVTDGSFDAYDANGNKRIEVGQLDDGTFDLAAFDPTTGAKVNLGQLAFGLRGDDTGGSITITGRSDSNYDYVTDPTFPGPICTGVLIGNSKRAIVFLSANIGHTLTGSGTDSRTGKMSFRIIDEWTGLETYTPFDSNAIMFETNGNGGGGSTSIRMGINVLVPSYAFPVANRKYTFEARYQVRAFSSGTMYFQDRSMFVLPF